MDGSELAWTPLPSQATCHPIRLVSIAKAYQSLLNLDVRIQCLRVKSAVYIIILCYNAQWCHNYPVPLFGSHIFHVQSLCNLLASSMILLLSLFSLLLLAHGIIGCLSKVLLTIIYIIYATYSSPKFYYLHLRYTPVFTDGLVLLSITVAIKNALCNHACLDKTPSSCQLTQPSWRWIMKSNSLWKW